MPDRRRLDTLEAKAKRVHTLNTPFDPANLLSNPANARAVLAIRRAIEGGAPLPTGCYRKGIGSTPDGLLAAEGIMHLHLGRQNTDELLYVVQYPEDVVLLELSDHTHFKTQPVGARLKAAHAAALAAKEAEIDALPKPKRVWAMKRRSGPIPTKPAAPSEPVPTPKPEDEPGSK